MAAGAMTVRLSLISEEWEKNWKKAAKSIENFGKDLEKTGKALTGTLTAPLAGFAAAALASSEKAKKAFEGFSTAVKSAMGKVGDSIIDAGVGDLMTKMAAGVKKAADWFDGLSASTKKTILVMGGIVAAIGPAMIAVGKLAGAFATLMAAMAGPAGVVAVLGALAAVVAGALVQAFSKAESASERLRKSLQGLSLDQLEANLAETKGKIADIEARIAGGTKTVAGTPTMYGLNAMPVTTALTAAETEAMRRDVEILRQQQADAEIRIRNYMMANPVGPPLPEGYNSGAYGPPMSGRGSSPESRGAASARIAEFDEAQRKLAEYKQAYADANAEATRAVGLAQDFGFQLADAFRNTVPLATQVAGAIKGIFDQLASGIGNSIAQLLVYGGNFGEMMKAMLKQVLASVISTFVTMAIQYTIGAIAGKAYAGAIASANVSASTMRAAAAAVAASIETFGLYGIAAAPGFASAAIAEVTAAAMAGKAAGTGIGLTAGMAEGGFALTPQMIAIAERGRPEAVMNEANMKRIFPAYMGSGAGGSTVVQMVVDGRTIGEAALENLPAAARRAGVAR